MGNLWLKEKSPLCIADYSLLIPYLKIASFFPVFHCRFGYSVVDSRFATF